MKRRRFVGLVLAAFMAGGGAAWGAADDAKPVLILVAASAKDAVAEIGKTFEKETGAAITVDAGASNVLANQIINGAPADLFLSANQEWADKINQEGFAARQRPLLTNSLVLIVPKGNPAKVADLADLTSDRVKRIALAGEKVPAGKYAGQALEAKKLLSSLIEQKKIVRGEDVRATLEYVENGEVEAGVVYSTDAKISAKVETVLTFDPTTYDKIIYPVMLLKAGQTNAAAQRFYDYLASDKAADIFRKHGFCRPTSASSVEPTSAKSVEPK